MTGNGLDFIPLVRLCGQTHARMRKRLVPVLLLSQSLRLTQSVSCRVYEPLACSPRDAFRTKEQREF